MSEKDEQNKIVEKEIPKYMIIYPNFEPIKESTKLKSKTNIKIEKNEDDDEKYEINETFLELVLKKPFSYGRNKIVNTLTKNLQSSSLSKKLLSDYRSERKTKISEIILCNLLAQNLNYLKLEENEVLYRIGENDNRLFYILSGRIQVLKLKELCSVTMTNLEYLNYCKFLYNKNEMHILNEVINNNSQILPFLSEQDVALVSKIYFMRELLEKIRKHMITRNIELIRFFHMNEYSYDDFNIDASEINSLENKKIHKIQGAEQEWEDYINEKCSPTESEYHFYEPFRLLLKLKQQKFVTCLVYENQSYLEPGDYFGDISYYSRTTENKYTIRAQKDSVLAFIKNNDYLNVIDPKRKMETLKEIAFLHIYFFFREISNISFEKNYYEYFSVQEYPRGTIIYTSGDKPKNLMFLKEGKLSFEIKCTIIDLFFLIQNLYNNLVSNPIFNKLKNYQKKKIFPKETKFILKKCVYDEKFKKLMRNNQQFLEELKKTKTFQISEIDGHEIIGIEEIFLNIPYIMKCTVNDKKVVLYEFSTKNIPKIIKDGSELLFSFAQTAINKIISLIKRLDNIKINSFNYEKMKFDTDLKINENEEIEAKANNDLNNINNFPKLKLANTLYDNYTKSKLNTNRETIDIYNNSNGLNSVDTSDFPLNTNNSFYRTNSPVKRSILSRSNIKEIIMQHKKFNKTNNFSKSNSKVALLKELRTSINRKSMFVP